MTKCKYTGRPVCSRRPPLPRYRSFKRVADDFGAIFQSEAGIELLVFVECKGQATPAANSRAHSPLREAKNYRGRY